MDGCQTPSITVRLYHIQSRGASQGIVPAMILLKPLHDYGNRGPSENGDRK